MKSTLDIVDVLWAKLDGSSLKASITGKIYKHSRPAGSQLEDIIINCLPVNNQALQKTVANVNIHVANKKINSNGVQDDTIADHVRLKALAAAAIVILKDNWTADLNYDVQQQTIIPDVQAGDYYINIRIEFNIENL